MRKRRVIHAVTVIFVLILATAALAAPVRLKISAKSQETLQRAFAELRDKPHLAYFLLGNVYFGEKDYSSAIDAFLKALSIKSDMEEAYYNIGAAHYNAGEVDEALAAFEDAQEVREDYVKAYQSAALIFHEKGDYDSAIAEQSRALEIEPGNPGLHFDLAVYYVDRYRFGDEETEDLEEGLLHYEKAEEIQPGFPHAKDNAGIISGILG
ncbi:MAG: tetratricopeptide repeat protein [archaeon]